MILKKNWIKWGVIVLSYACIVIGLWVNFSRTTYTAKILGFPIWTYLPILILEHIIGAFALAIIFFSLFLLVLKDSPNKLLFTKRGKKEWLSDLKIITFFGLFFSLIVSLRYELFYEKAATLWQLPFDVIGLIVYGAYINWIYKISGKKEKKRLK